MIGYFAQHQAEELNPENGVITEVENSLRMEANPRAALGALLFSGNSFQEDFRSFRRREESSGLSQIIDEAQFSYHGRTNQPFGYP